MNKSGTNCEQIMNKEWTSHDYLKKIMGLKKFWVWILLGPKKLWFQKMFWSEKKFEKNFGSEKNWKFLGVKKI